MSIQEMNMGVIRFREGSVMGFVMVSGAFPSRNLVKVNKKAPERKALTLVGF